MQEMHIPRSLPMSLARYHRLKGDEVCFLTGVDEHAANVYNAAKEEGLSPQAYCDKIAPTICYQAVGTPEHLA